jgi:hypothetical protein
MTKDDPATGSADEGAAPAPHGVTRAQAIQRVQLGLFGLAAMLLLVGLANIIMERAQETDKSSVPAVTAPVAAGSGPAPQSDPLADAGVVPDIADDGPAPAASPAAASAPSSVRAPVAGSTGQN